ncbi:MAG: radical SAM protein, partial [Candidatus Cryptobacteroides sp.]|uniref:radical SAM protein n=1 Tax=Candidatus Cryptobacteroides sp. TaxID=2952915 RepID=UPI002A837549
MILDVNGKKIDVKEYGCRMGDIPARKVIPSVSIFTKVTGGCPAGCLFCSNAGAEHVASSYDIEKLAAFSQELMDAGVEVHRLNITGGEPSLVPDRVEAILDRFSKG